MPVRRAARGLFKGQDAVAPHERNMLPGLYVASGYRVFASVYGSRAKQNVWPSNWGWGPWI
jgi:hypothetical protein